MKALFDSLHRQDAFVAWYAPDTKALRPFLYCAVLEIRERWQILLLQEAYELVNSTALHELHLKAFEDLDTMLTTPQCFEKLPDVAFGLVKMAPETDAMTYAGRFGIPLPQLTKIIKGNGCNSQSGIKGKNLNDNYYWLDYANVTPELHPGK